MFLRSLALSLLIGAAALVRAEPPASEPPATAAVAADEAPAEPIEPPVSNTLELQVELHRRGFSCGSIDGVAGAQTTGALKAFQRSMGIKDSGVLDPKTREYLLLSAPALKEHVVGPGDLAGLQPLATTWVEKSERNQLGHASVLEVIGERYHANPKFLRRLNPEVDWESLLPGAKLTVPAVDAVTLEGTPAQIVITLSARELELVDENSRVIAHFPVSIARMAEKRPVGDLKVVVVIPDPDYTFDPKVFPESAEARSLGRKLIIPPGPNNPVGVAWIGLDRPGFGIHGTPDPEHVGRTESHGCFRLANWDALTLLHFARVGMPVLVEP